MPGQIDKTDLLRMTAEIATAYVGRNSIAGTEISEVVKLVHSVLTRLGGPQAQPQTTPQEPAVPIRKSVTKDYIICLEDGKKLKMLKRHLRATYDLSPDEYRAKWGLPADYPMVAPGYAERRSEFAKQIGLGRGGRRRKAA